VVNVYAHVFILLSVVIVILPEMMTRTCFRSKSVALAADIHRRVRYLRIGALATLDWPSLDVRGQYQLQLAHITRHYHFDQWSHRNVTKKPQDALYFMAHALLHGRHPPEVDRG